MSDLIERLRKAAYIHWQHTESVDATKMLENEAADEIERLTADLKAERKQRAYERRIYTARVDELEATLDAESRNRVRIARWLLEQKKEIERLEDEVRAWRSTVEALRFEAARFTDFLTICEDALNDSKEQTTEQEDTDE